MQALIEIIVPVFALMAIGYLAGRLGLFGQANVGVLTQVTFVLFMPPLLFRAMATVDMTSLSFSSLATYYSVALTVLFVFVVGQAMTGQTLNSAMIRSLGAVFSNMAIIGTPIIQLSFGSDGLAILLPIIALHALILLTVSTLVLEWSIATEQSKENNHLSSSNGARSHGPNYGAIVFQALRSAIIHPVVLPILLGLLWGATHWELPVVADRTLALLGQAGIPASLVLLGATLASYGLRTSSLPAILLSLGKLIVMPGLMYVAGRWVFDLAPLPLAVVTVCAALPTGANVYLLSQRYGTQVATISATCALSTLGAVLTLSLLLPFFAK